MSDVIKDCLTRAQKAYEEIPGDPQERPIWDWNRIRTQIEAMVYGYIAKYHGEQPRIVETLPRSMLKKWRAIEICRRHPTLSEASDGWPAPAAEFGGCTGGPHNTISNCVAISVCDNPRSQIAMAAPATRGPTTAIKSLPSLFSSSQSSAKSSCLRLR